jgi:hypothetical protein
MNPAHREPTHRDDTKRDTPLAQGQSTRQGVTNGQVNRIMRGEPNRTMTSHGGGITIAMQMKQGHGHAIPHTMRP